MFSKGFCGAKPFFEKESLSFTKKETTFFSFSTGFLFVKKKKCYATKRGDRAYRMVGKDRVE